MNDVEMGRKGGGMGERDRMGWDGMAALGLPKVEDDERRMSPGCHNENREQENSRRKRPITPPQYTPSIHNSSLGSSTTRTDFT